MSRSVDIHCSSIRPEAAADDAQWVEIYFPKIEDLLQRLVESHTARRHAVRALLFGSWKMAAVGMACFICVPGGAAAAAIFLIRSEAVDLPPIRIEPVSAKADRLPQIAPVTKVNYFGQVKLAPFDEARAEIREEPDAFEQAALRGTVEDALLTASATEPPLPNKRKSRRNSARSAFAKLQLENPEPAPRQPSLLEKLLGAIVSIAQPPQQPGQRQT